MNEKFISNFVESQFPEFYRDEGPKFVAFVKAYYEWLETEGQEISDTRKFLDEQNIDTTSSEFIEHFLKKYLFGIPQATLLNKESLVKHIKDVYRAKGSERGWKLLFRLLFNEDLEFFLPSENILKPSDGNWYDPKYIQVKYSDKLPTYVGSRVYGTSSNTSAIIESIITEPFNQNIITTIYLSNIIPRNSEFLVGEKIALQNELNTEQILDSPTVMGCMRSVEILSGGQDFEVGNILRIVEKDVFTGEYITKGTGGEVRVTKTSKGLGSIRFDVRKMGSGYNTSPAIIQYKNPEDTTGMNAEFQIGSLSNLSYITYNSDILADYAETTFEDANFNFPGALYSNKDTALGDALTYVTEARGSITTITNTFAGNSYTKELDIRVAAPIFGKPLPTSVTFSYNSNVVTVSNSAILSNFEPMSVIKLGNEFHSVSAFSGNTINLVGPTKSASNANTTIQLGHNLYSANWGSEAAIELDGSIKSNNALITGIPTVGNGVIQEVISTRSGKGYNQDEEVTLYLYGAITKPNVVDGGRKYANGEALIFEGGSTNSKANGYVLTNSNGTITDCVMYSYGSAYKSIPTVSVKTRKGSNAHLEVDMGDFNTFSKVKGTINLAGVGFENGRWLSTASFLNSDKKIQDSYFYQDFSYLLRSSVDLNKYKELLLNIFHTTGYEMFGEYFNSKKEKIKVKLISEEMNIG